MDGDQQSLEDRSAPQAASCAVPEAVSKHEGSLFLWRRLVICGPTLKPKTLIAIVIIKATMSLGQTESISKLLLFIKLFRVFYLSPRRSCFPLWFFVGWFDTRIKQKLQKRRKKITKTKK